MVTIRLPPPPCHPNHRISPQSWLMGPVTGPPTGRGERGPWRQRGHRAPLGAVALGTAALKARHPRSLTTALSRAAATPRQPSRAWAVLEGGVVRKLTGRPRRCRSRTRRHRESRDGPRRGHQIRSCRRPSSVSTLGRCLWSCSRCWCDGRCRPLRKPITVGDHGLPSSMLHLCPLRSDTSVGPATTCAAICQQSCVVTNMVRFYESAESPDSVHRPTLLPSVSAFG